MNIIIGRLTAAIEGAKSRGNSLVRVDLSVAEEILTIMKGTLPSVAAPPRQAPEPLKVALRDLEEFVVLDDELYLVKQKVIECFKALLPEAVDASPIPDAIPPMPEILGKNDATRTGWGAYFEGKNDDQCPFPMSRSDLHREWQRGWREANKSVVRPERTPEPSSKPCQLDGEVDAALAKLETVIEFLMGEGPMKGRSFGDSYEHLGPFWWRTDLREARDDLLKAMRPESWAELTPPL